MEIKDKLFAQNWIEQLRGDTSPGSVTRLCGFGSGAISSGMVWSFTREGFEIWDRRDLWLRHDLKSTSCR